MSGSQLPWGPPMDKDLLSSTRLDTSLLSLSLNTSSATRVRGGAAAPVEATSSSSFLSASLTERMAGARNSFSSGGVITPKKMGGAGSGSSLLSLPGSSSAKATCSLMRTPTKKHHTTPLMSPARMFKSPAPSSAGRQTPSGDRFIPNRSATDFDRAHFLLMRSGDENQAENGSPNQVNRRRKLRQALMSEGTTPPPTSLTPSGNNAAAGHSASLLSYRRKPNSSKEALRALSASADFQLVALRLSAGGGGGISDAVRKVPSVPERILDAPDILNDYYLNPLDWNASSNCLAVALANYVYIWNAGTGDVSPLMRLNSPEDYICSVKWVSSSGGSQAAAGGSNILAVGQSDGDVTIWNVDQLKRLRTLKGHTDRASSLSWNHHILSSGSRSGEIHHSDVRVPDHLVSSVKGHQREICGLSWSPDGKLLASGGNDNAIKIWSMNHNTPKSTFSDHGAAVKALAWCPWQNNVLASGGGTADKTIKIWNCNTQTLLQSIDTKSQVCSLVWSEPYRELASAHGYPNNNIVLWKHSRQAELTRVAELSGHGDRVLALCSSFDGTTLISAGADETLQLWKCFPQKERKKSAQKTPIKKSDKNKVINRAGIR